MNIIRLELTEQEAKIYDEVMEKVDKTAAFLAGLSPEERLDWLKEHQYIHPISFEREIGGTANDVSDIVPMQDLFNEWHAKNTSDKVRRVMQSRGNTGIPLTTSAPYGYKKSRRTRTSGSWTSRRQRWCGKSSSCQSAAWGLLKSPRSCALRA